MLGPFGWRGGVFRKPFSFGEFSSMILEEQCDCVVQVLGKRGEQ